VTCSSGEVEEQQFAHALTDSPTGWWTEYLVDGELPPQGNPASACSSQQQQSHLRQRLASVPGLFMLPKAYQVTDRLPAAYNRQGDLMAAAVDRSARGCIVVVGGGAAFDEPLGGQVPDTSRPARCQAAAGSSGSLQRQYRTWLVHVSCRHRIARARVTAETGLALATAPSSSTTATGSTSVDSTKWSSRNGADGSRTREVAVPNVFSFRLSVARGHVRATDRTSELSSE
jgi:hypothetical protein